MSQRPLEVSRPVAVAPAERVVLRSATLDDIDVLISLINAAYDHTEHHIFPGSRRTDRHDIRQLVAGVVVAELDGRIAACIHIDTTGDPAHYGLLAVDVSLHRSGLGSRLAAHAEAVARDHGASAVRVETVKQAGLIPFYEKRGYRTIGETDGQIWNGGADWGAIIPWQMVDLEKPLR